MSRRGARLGDELAVQDFTDQVFRQVEQIGIGGEALGGGVHGGCGVLDVVDWRDLIALTPALSRWEREKNGWCGSAVNPAGLRCNARAAAQNSMLTSIRQSGRASGETLSAPVAVRVSR